MFAQIIHEVRPPILKIIFGNFRQRIREMMPRDVSEARELIDQCGVSIELSFLVLNHAPDLGLEL
jgi:hypothetical protein